MAKRTAARRTRATSRKTSRKTARSVGIELPPTLAAFARQVRTRLNAVEKDIQRAEARYRKQFTRLLREGSHQLGRLEAHGEKRWRTLTTQARRDALKLLHRLERTLQPPKPKRKVAPRKRPAAQIEGQGSGV